MARKTDEFEFHIQAYSPETMPMARLAEYIGDLARLLGETAHVHFVRVKKGSTTIVHRVEPEASVTVRYRARLAKSEDAPPDVKAAANQLKSKLRTDNAKGARLVDPEGDNILEFKIPKNQQADYPTISEPGFVQGQVIRLGGSGDWVPVHLEDVDGRTYTCEAKKEKTKELAPYYLNGLIRAKGTGRWARRDEGGWDLENFRIHDFSPIKPDSLLDSVERLRTIDANWKHQGDALEALHKIRHGDLS